MGFIILTFPGRDLAWSWKKPSVWVSTRDRAVSLPGWKPGPQGCCGLEKKPQWEYPTFWPQKLTEWHKSLTKRKTSSWKPAWTVWEEYFQKPHPCGIMNKRILLFFPNIICVHAVFVHASWLPPSQAVRFPAPHFQLGEKEGIWLDRPGIPPQDSMPKPLVYNGPVRITAGA